METRHLTRKQRMLLDVFEASRRPLTPQEAWESARREDPRIGLATVYRAVRVLHEGSAINRVEIAGEPTRYEYAQARAHHHHFYCRACGRIIEIRGCPRDLAACVPEGCTMEDHKIVLYGVCDRCS